MTQKIDEEIMIILKNYAATMIAIDTAVDQIKQVFLQALPEERDTRKIQVSFEQYYNPTTSLSCATLPTPTSPPR
jgi:hypothetical protein